jgi:hypothetical protein
MKTKLSPNEVENISKSVRKNHKNNTLEKLKNEAVKACHSEDWSGAESAIEELFAIALCNEAELLRRIGEPMEIMGDRAVLDHDITEGEAIEIFERHPNITQIDTIEGYYPRP